MALQDLEGLLFELRVVICKVEALDCREKDFHAKLDALNAEGERLSLGVQSIKAATERNT